MMAAGSWSAPRSLIEFAEEKIKVPLSATDKRRLFHLLMRIRNGSPKTLRLVDRFDAGEIDGAKLLEMMG